MSWWLGWLGVFGALTSLAYWFLEGLVRLRRGEVLRRQVLGRAQAKGWIWYWSGLMAPLGELLSPIMERVDASGWESRIQQAGLSPPLRPADWLATSLVLAFIGGLIPIWAGWGWELTLASLGLGALAPGIWVRRRADQRQESVARSLPFLIDLLVIGMRAGLSLDRALTRMLTRIPPGPLVEDVMGALQEMRMGKKRAEALRDMAARAQESSLTSFVATILQADQLGTGVAEVLQILSRQMRQRQSQRVETQALTASVRLLFPLVFCVFPAVLIVLFGPILLTGPLV